MIKPASLKNIRTLKGLSDGELEDVGRNLAQINLEKGAHLFYRNDQGAGVYFLVKGSIQITIDNEDSKEIVVYVIQEGDVVGEMSLFAHPERSATAVALERCQLYKIGAEKFMDLMNIYPAIPINLARTLAERLYEANAIIERLGTMDGLERVVNYIGSLASRGDDSSGDFYKIKKKPTHRTISQRLGLSEKTVYRAIRSLMDEGSVEIRDGALYIRKSRVEKRS